MRRFCALLLVLALLLPCFASAEEAGTVSEDYDPLWTLAEPYGFMLKIDGVEHPMRIGTFHFNWWDVTKFDLNIAVDTTAKTVTMQSSTQQIDNDGSTLHSTQTETFSLSDPEISFGFGES